MPRHNHICFRNDLGALLLFHKHLFLYHMYPFAAPFYNNIYNVNFIRIF